jgi:uncharacterized protein (UPF0332 family)
MPVAPTDWLTFAKGLLSNDEIGNRSAASRAYYSAFHASKPLADQLPDPIESDGMHDRAIRAMKEYPVTVKNRDTAMAIHRVGIQLAQCRSIRTRADYKCGEVFSKSEAQEAILFAEQIVAGLQTIKFP